MCNCFTETLDKVKEHIKPQLPAKHSDLKIDWIGYSYILSGKPFVPVNPKISIEYCGFKKNGDPKANLTKDDMTIMARYCPFCGEDTKAQENWKDASVDLPIDEMNNNPDMHYIKLWLRYDDDSIDVGYFCNFEMDKFYFSSSDGLVEDSRTVTHWQLISTPTYEVIK